MKYKRKTLAYQGDSGVTRGRGGGASIFGMHLIIQ
jgi:hypothetical protein